MSTNSNEQPWWIPATERPPEVGELMQAFVDAGLCQWDARTRPYPQDYALVAWSALQPR